LGGTRQNSRKEKTDDFVDVFHESPDLVPSSMTKRAAFIHTPFFSHLYSRPLLQEYFKATTGPLQ
jgi:hypothetical protein